MSKRKWGCIEVIAQEEDGRNAATVFLQGEGVQVSDVIGALDRAFPRSGGQEPAEPVRKKRRSKKVKAG